MGKRLPKRPPAAAIRTGDGKYTPSSKRKGKPPYQERISVSDIPTNATLPQFISKENDEMRRIQLALEEGLKEIKGGGDKLIKKPTAPVAPGSEPGGSGESEDTQNRTINWALTTEHNDGVITAKVVQDVDYWDTGKALQKYDLGIVWELLEKPLEQTLKTIPAALKTQFKAWAYTNPAQFLDWLNSAFRPIMSITGGVNSKDGVYEIHFVNDKWNPGVWKYYGTNGFQAKGYHPLPRWGLRVIAIPFNLSLPIVTSNAKIPLGNTIVRTEVHLTEAYDASATLVVAVNGVSVFDVGQINMKESGLYISQWRYSNAAEAPGVVTTSPGSSTTGAGVAYIYHTELET